MWMWEWVRKKVAVVSIFNIHRDKNAIWKLIQPRNGMWTFKYIHLPGLIRIYLVTAVYMNTLSVYVIHTHYTEAQRRRNTSSNFNPKNPFSLIFENLVKIRDSQVFLRNRMWSTIIFLSCKFNPSVGCRLNPQCH